VFRQFVAVPFSFRSIAPTVPFLFRSLYGPSREMRDRNASGRSEHISVLSTVKAKVIRRFLFMYDDGS
jgi:hypothetical protein